MRINATAKTVTYSLDDLEGVEAGLNEIERAALESEDITPEDARDICSNLRMIRDCLKLKQGVLRHAKWAPELQNK